MNVNEQAKINVEITPQAPLNVTIGECAKMDCERALNYIKSGEVEIEQAVQDGIEDFNENAVSKTSDFNDNVVQKTNAFNQNAVNKTQDFDDNAAIKQAAVDASAAEAKQWAIGDPTEPDGYSAKYWAGQASSELSTLENDVSAIQAVIPAQASSSNQLADKSFVNSSISTNTANFIGTFNSVAELEAYSGTLTNNDYAFVKTTDTAGNTLYDRYKWNGSEWLFEYELNNSSFTAAQWAAINSGATAGKLANYVTTNTTQTITSEKTVSGTQFKVRNADQYKLLTYDTRIDRGVAPQSWTGMFPYLLIDGNGKRLGGLYCTYDTNMKNTIRLIAYKGTSTDSTDYGFSAVEVGYDSSTRAYAKAPTPFEDTTSSTQIDTVGARNTKLQSYVSLAGTETVSGDKSFTGTVTAVTQATSDSSTKLATTAFVSNKFQVVQALPVTPDADTFYFIEE